MAEYTHIDKENILENITLREVYCNGVLCFRELYAHDSYAIYDTTEELYTDPETGDTYPPIYSYMACLPLSVDYTVYRAILITPDMEVVGKPNTEVTE